MEELDVRTERQNRHEGWWERLRHVVNPCALWMLSRSGTTLLKVNVSCQKMQGSGWMSADVLHLPVSAKGTWST